jgi:predicted nicotinamide N-methyase
VHRDIAGYPAELLRLELEAATPDRPVRALEIWTVADLERLVDAEALLRAIDPPDPPYWALPWIGARAIAARLLTTPPPASTRVLEIGCGLGLAGVAAGSGGAHVVFTDYVSEALAFARANAEHHRRQSFDTRVADFTRDRLDARYDLIVAADVVYEPQSYAPLVDFLAEHTAPRGRVLLTESLRADAKHVLAMLVERGFDLSTEAAWIPEDGKLERTWLHELRRRG